MDHLKHQKEEKSISKFFRKYKYVFVWYTTICYTKVAITPKKDNNISIFHSQYHGCWCLGGTRSQFINSHGIDAICPNNPGPGR